MVRKLLFALAVAASLAHPMPGFTAQPSQSVTVTPQPSLQAPQALTIALNKSQVLRVSQTVGRIAVGNAAIVDAVALTDRSFYLLGKAVGTTNLSVYGQNSQLLAVLDVTVGADVDGVKAALHQMMPDDRIEVRAINDSIALSGTVGSPAKVTQAMEIARKFVTEDDKDKDKSKVLNNLGVRGAQQVMLQVKVAEMQRNVSKAFNFHPFISAGKPGAGNIGGNGFKLAPLDPVDTSNFATIAGSAVAGNFTFQLLIDALESKGAVKILAEPNLVAMSGDTASFLAGGEFPVPVAQNTASGVPTVTVEFKPFGISLAFTPTVIDDLINLVVAPEVSQIDKTNSVTFTGFTIPGIATRRARTTVELRDGQSFAIAGLISSDFDDTVRGIPGIMDVPVLGALFRSPSYQNNETELVIIITPHLVQPAPAGTLKAPTDSFVPPSDAQIFLLGNTENPDSGLPPSNGGLTGRYGHIIR
ncbi:general secretion pathway protein [Aliidongia dinghuensis]|uniref:General secretion pathway protein n=1 Tax=Aliidongia dinghuensis TaxID=1867774 RepID=A0A8J2YSY2_9PROT|nr:type II and III secretion system protein family protein [Aliidongia dinghuensis]GGF14290.1 general secretion pathway protein [Aliidongia dinghuensis]